MNRLSCLSRTLLFLSILTWTSSCSSTQFAKEISTYRHAYKNDFNQSDHAPLKGTQLDDMRFYKASKKYRVKAKVIRNEAPIPFDINTSSGSVKQFYKYADLEFNLSGKPYKLELYQNLRTIKNPIYKNLLFLMFNDQTNGDETYGGGRYIDLQTTDIVADEIWIDFNKCYNPYCAYSDGYNCPIPPVANNLDVAIKAGEKMYVGPYLGADHE